MDLATQIRGAAAYRPAPPPEVRTSRQLEHLTELHQVNQDAATTRYQLAMQGRGWMSTFELECALGLKRFCCRPKIDHLLEEGLVERRNRGGAERYSKRGGWEWRWKEEGNSHEPTKGNDDGK